MIVYWGNAFVQAGGPDLSVDITVFQMRLGM